MATADELKNVTPITVTKRQYRCADRHQTVSVRCADRHQTVSVRCADRYQTAATAVLDAAGFAGPCSYFNPTTIESGPLRCSTRVCLKPAARIQAAQSAPV